MKKLFDTTIDIDRRLFYVLAWTACIANTIGFVSNYIFYGPTGSTIFCGICAAIMYVSALLGIYGQGIAVAKLIILLVVNVLEFPFLYYEYGAGRTVYMLLGIIAIIAFAKRIYRTIMATLVIIYDAAVIIIAALYPNNNVVVSQANDLGAAVSSFLIVAVSITLIILILIMQQEKQNEELSKLTEELSAMAHLDPLSQLYNRRYLTEYLDEKMASHDAEFAVALLDLDDFKSVNDRFGHVYGDRVLQVFADIMKKEMNGIGIAARYGGEEFMLVFDTINQDQTKAVSDRIRQQLLQFAHESKGIDITYSGGFEIFHNEDRITQLFNAADEKLYTAKHAGKNRIIF